MPLDMLIESRLRHRLPVLRPAQFLSVSALAQKAMETATHPEVVKITPRRIMRANLTLGGAYALFLEELFEGAALPAAPYRKMEGVDTSKRLFQHWKQRAPNLKPGDEYDLVDEFADRSASGTGTPGFPIPATMKGGGSLDSCMTNR